VGPLGTSVAAGVGRALLAAVVTGLVVLLARDRVAGDVAQLAVGVPVGVVAYAVATAALARLGGGAPGVRRPSHG
jgi:hypothetical protein